MTLPAALLGFGCCLLVGSLFHVWRNGGCLRLLLYMTLSCAGGAVGQWLAGAQGWTFLAVGPLNLGFVMLGSLLFLAIGYWLSLVELRGPERRDDRV